METLFIGKNMLFLPEVESTNTYAMNLLRNVNTIEGTTIITDHQTKGKGQRGSLWHSNIAQNLTTSIILKPHFLSINASFYLSKISALAVHDVLTEIFANRHYDIKIKWPNDILIDKQKIAGILIENNFSHTNIQSSVLGFGINVNQTDFDNYNRQATSIKLLLNQDFEREELLQKLCKNIEKWYLKLKEGKQAMIDEQYFKNLYLMQQVAMFADAHEKRFMGKIKTITPKGHLVLELEHDVIKEFDVKDIRFLS